MTVAAPSANGSSTSSRPAAPRSDQRPPSALEVIRSAERSDAESAANPESAGAGPQPRELFGGLAGNRGSQPDLWF